MSNFCPEWVFGVCAAKTSSDFLSTNNSVNMIAKKFSSGLSGHFNEIKFEEIAEVSELILGFLSEVNAGENAVEFLNNYIFYRVSFSSNGNPRKIKSMFSSEYDGTKLNEYGSKNVLKVFRATTFSINNGVYEKAPAGWTITDVEDIDWLGELFNQDVSFSDI
jgi:hypothetical protein